MENINWLMYAGMVFGAGIGFCLWRLGHRQTALAKRLVRLEQTMEKL